ncbi:hypothetical protein G7K_2964-t1 [Saitoella complicata NRRL Y-17804]|uniref:Uncharacterized protein n=1 Tax=Saitoella complicata (strain BCRC 22490 / CBS 7301 / JCM 7358 / NBRC 10748 / NRRL Y-17804) TaxID=698492 RepID=A0A0E9NHA9_SAICN|nr:hypothetical protein G7K_2964-t1 [Saitoella complicata NRRL Y-17804]
MGRFHRQPTGCMDSVPLGRLTRPIAFREDEQSSSSRYRPLSGLIYATFLPRHCPANGKTQLNDTRLFVTDRDQDLQEQHDNDSLLANSNRDNLVQITRSTAGELPTLLASHAVIFTQDMRRVAVTGRKGRHWQERYARGVNIR